MSVMIENTEELLILLKKMDMKVTSVDELRHLLTTINASYNPDATRQKIGKQIGTVVPGFLAGAASIASFFLFSADATTSAVHSTVGALAVIWGPVALVSTAAVIAGAVLAGVRRGQTLSDVPPNRPVSREGPIVTHITKDLSL